MTPMKTLVIDVGGTNLKLFATGQPEVCKIPSGPEMTAEGMISAVREKPREAGITRSYRSAIRARLSTADLCASHTIWARVGSISTSRGNSAGP